MPMYSLTPDTLIAGHAVCDCGEFTYIFRQCAMQRLPNDYSGELCRRCGMWMCRLDKLMANDAQPTAPRSSNSCQNLTIESQP